MGIKPAPLGSNHQVSSTAFPRSSPLADLGTSASSSKTSGMV